MQAWICSHEIGSEFASFAYFAVNPVCHDLSGHPRKSQKEEGRIKKSKKESGSTFGCFSDFLNLNSLRNPWSNSLTPFLLSIFPISAFLSILRLAVFVNTLLTTGCDSSKCRNFHCCFSGAIGFNASGLSNSTLKVLRDCNWPGLKNGLPPLKMPGALFALRMLVIGKVGSMIGP